jgi:hypothetical protein
MGLTFPEQRCREAVFRIAMRKERRWYATDPRASEVTQENQRIALFVRAFLPYVQAKLMRRLWARDHDIEGVERPPGFW